MLYKKNYMINEYCRYDEGTIMIKVGREEPAISMDVNGGKIIWAKHSEMQQVNLKALPEGENKVAIHIWLCNRRFSTVLQYRQHDSFLKFYRYRNQGRRACASDRQGHGLLRNIPSNHSTQPQRKIRGGLRRWRVHHLHRYGIEEQGFWNSPRICLGIR